LMANGGVKSIHVAESKAEDDFLRHGGGEWRAFLDKRVGPVPFVPPSMSPVRYLDELGVLRPGLLAVHCVRVNEDDARILASRKAVAVLCPRSNEYLGNGVPPLALLFGNGVSIALGTDSLASCDSLNVLDDARLLAGKFPRVPHSALLHALTRGGALALDFPGLGEVRPGSMARFAAVAFDGAVPADPVAFVLKDSAPARGIA
ncbi:MAG: amidohydrolase family protein, partial [Vicinamibacteria bacterium]